MEWGFRPANPNVPFGPYLTREYGIDPAKPQKLLGVVEPAVAEEIMGTWQDVKKPGVVVLVLDVSGSMAGEKLAQAKKAALRFLDTMSVHNHVGLLTFSGSINKEIAIAPVTSNKFDLAEAIESSQAAGETALYDAVKRAVEMADRYPLSGEAIRGVVLLSDGVRTSGSVKLPELIELRTDQEQPVPNFDDRQEKRGLHGLRLASSNSHPIHIFSIAYGTDADLEVLRIFSEASNSTFNRADEKNITEVLELFGKYF
jgi:Ca-activated chloride channel family protein